MIKEFQGEYRWLSNFAAVNVNFEGKVYPSVEHAYVAAKSTDETFREYCTDIKTHPAEVKQAGKEIPLRPDWDEVKEGVMMHLLKEKYNQEPYKTQLIETKDTYIQEGNWWGDKVWGYCFKTNEGDNLLGIMIMEIRRKLIRDAK